MPRTGKHLAIQTVWITLLDIAALLAGGLVGVLARIGAEEMGEYVFEHIDGWLILFGGVIVANYIAGSYRVEPSFSRFNMVVLWLFSLVFATAVVSFTSYAWFRTLLGRGVLGISVLAYGIVSLSGRLLLYGRVFRSGIFVCRTVVVGAGARAREVRRAVENKWIVPEHRVAAWIEIVGERNGATGFGEAAEIEGVPVVRTDRAGFAAAVKRLDANLIVLTRDFAPEKEMHALLRRLRFEGIEILTALNAAEIYAGRSPLDLLDEAAMMRAVMESGLPMVRHVKRFLDVAAALTLGTAMLPVAAIAALAIKLSCPREPVLYSQRRVGEFGRLFRLWKFRTMHSGAEAETGAVWAAKGDRRVTPVGRVLRKYRIDEIPQLLNVLKGDMSLVGPRPERPEIAEELERRIPFYAERLNVPPGLTGWAQIRYPYGDSVEDARRKLEHDLYYVKHVSVGLDIQVLLRTLRIMCFGLERSA